MEPRCRTTKKNVLKQIYKYIYLCVCVCNMINVFQTRGLDCSGKYHHHHHLYSREWALASSMVNIWTLFYLTTHNILHSDSFAWWLAVQCSLLSNLTGDGGHTFQLNVLQLTLGLLPTIFNPLNAELNPICHLLALLGVHFLHVIRIRVKSLTLRLLMSYIYIYMTLVA